MRLRFKQLVFVVAALFTVIFATGTAGAEEQPGVILKLIGNSNTTEDGGTRIFKVKLGTQPSADVEIRLSSSDTDEGTVAPSKLSFTPDNWNGFQEVTVTGQDDGERDGTVSYDIRLSPCISDDPDYGDNHSATVPTKNIDNDTPGIMVEASGTVLYTSEKGKQASFSVNLLNPPSADVILYVTTSDTGEGSVFPEQLIFKQNNWSGLQSVTITGVDDDEVDGDQDYTITLSPVSDGDSGYNELDDKTVAAINMDYDQAGFNITSETGTSLETSSIGDDTVLEGGQTTEEGGSVAFSVSLTSKPQSNVTLSVTSSDKEEGIVSPATLTFTPDNWNALHTVTVTGQPDSIIDGNQSYSILLGAAAGDSNYTGLDPDDVALTNIDKDTAGFILEGIEDQNFTSEDGGQFSFDVKLTSKPEAEVTISLGISNDDEGTLSPWELTFTPDNWNGLHTVTVTGVDDASPVVDGDQSYRVEFYYEFSEDKHYADLTPPAVPMINIDNDRPGFSLSEMSGETTEAGGQASFAVNLISQPTSNVTITVNSSDTSEGTVSPANLTFTPEDWNSSDHLITVTGVNDDVADGNQSYTIILGTASSSDAYNGKDPDDISLINIDDNIPGFIVGEITGKTTEQGGEATFTLTLKSQPTAEVVISLSSSDEDEGTVSPAQIIFTKENWDALHTVTVTGVDDQIKDGNQSYTIILKASSSSDSNYDAIDLQDITVVNMDYGDEPGFKSTSLGEISRTSEDGKEQAAFRVQLLSEPTANVTVNVTSSDTSEGTVSPSKLVFTPSDWNSADHMITVTGVDDSSVDGSQSYSVVLEPASSDDSNYDGWDPDDLPLINMDNDKTGFVRGELSSTTTSEDEGSASVTIRLQSEPSDDVMVCAESSDETEGTVSPQCLIFTQENWSADQSFIIIGEADGIDDGDQAYTVIIKPAESSDSNYAGWDPDDISLVNIDIDEAGFKEVEMAEGKAVTTEKGGQVFIRVELTSAPTADVTIAVSSSDETEGTVSPSEIVFTPSDWSAQTITVTGQNDDIADGPQAYFVVMAPAVSDSAYNGLKLSNIPVINEDDDKFGFKVSELNGDTDENGGQASFTVELTSKPTAAVSISIYSSDTDEGTVSPSSLNFDAGNWSMAQTVTITGVSDEIVDGNQSYSIVIEPASSSDSNYNGIDLLDIQVTNINTDTLLPPTDLRAHSGVNSIRLYWDDSISPYLAGYYVYRSESESGTYTRITAEVIKGNSYTDRSEFAIGIVYWYYVISVDMVGNESEMSNKAWAEPGRLKLFIPDSSAGANTQVRLPVNIDNADGLDLCSADITLSYDTNVLYIPPEEGDERAETSALTAMYGWEANLEQPGQVRIAASTWGGVDKLYGEGTLFYILFDVVGNEGDWTDMVFTDEDMMTGLYSCDDPINPLPVDLSDIGRFTVMCGFMLGDLTGDCLVNQDDVRRAREISCKKRENNDQLLRAGDLSGDGRIRSNDATLIERLANSLPLAPSREEEIRRKRSTRSNQVTVDIPDEMPISPDSSVWIPVEINNASALKGGEIVLNYDASLVTATGSRAGSAMGDFEMTFNRSSGQVRISFNAIAEAENLPEGIVALAEIRFTATNRNISDGKEIPIVLAGVRLSDAYGRDFETSARQMDVKMSDGSLIVGEGAVSPELMNAIKILQVLVGMKADVDEIVDVNDDQQVGLEEAIYLIQVAAEIRDASKNRR
jgi:hypothetical protein